MNKFGYAQSNSLLKQEIEDLSTDNDNLPERSSSNMNGFVHASTDKQQKIVPAKKFQNVKHRTNIQASNIQPSTTSTLESECEIEIVTPNDSDGKINIESKKQSRKPRVRKPRRSIPNEKEYIPENEQPTQSDVVGGRGGRSNHHPGNRPYWIRILESRNEYTKSRSDHEKARIANGILRYVQEELRGRFLNIDSKTKGWYILPNTVVLDKIKQALRDKYIPYWARDLKIKDKKHHPMGSVLGANGNAAGNSALRQSIVNKRPQLGLDAMMPLGSSYASMQNSRMFNPAATMATINASRVNGAIAPNLPNSTATSTAETISRIPNNTEKTTNKLDFLFGSSTRRPMGQTAAIPTIDDILKHKIDQMPSFGGVPNAEFIAAAMANTAPPPIPSIGMNPFQSNLPPNWMSSLGLGGLGGNGALLSEAMNQSHGFGATGNLGAPALPNTATPTSLAVLQSLSMKSLDNYLEKRLAEKIAGLPPSLATPASLASQGFGIANLPSLSRLNALTGTSFDSATSHSGLSAAFAAPVAAAPTGPMKTDWNAMYTRALTNTK